HARAQEPPPRIGPFVVDLHGTFPKFGGDAQLAESRGLVQAELPGLGIGVSAGVHVYFLKVSAVTFGVGGEATYGRSPFTPPSVDSGTSPFRPVTETFKSIAPQLSMNFGSGTGWSYLSAGIGRSVWSIVPDDGQPLETDEESIRTINYGGGARWFA